MTGDPIPIRARIKTETRTGAQFPPDCKDDSEPSLYHLGFWRWGVRAQRWGPDTEYPRAIIEAARGVILDTVKTSDGIMFAVFFKG